MGRGRHLNSQAGRLRYVRLLAVFSIGRAPEQSRFVKILFSLECFERDEMDLSTETGNDRAFLVSMANSFRWVWILAGVETTIRPPGPAKISYLRFPHDIGRWVEGAELENWTRL